MKGYKLGLDAGSSLVEEVRSIPIEGNIIPPSWFQHIRYSNGKPCLNAIVILSDIVYWYRPMEVRNERTGQVVEYRKKFKGDYLQRTAAAAAEQFGLTQKQAKDALDLLSDLGIIRKQVVPSMETKNGKKLGNVPYIELVPSKLREITLTLRPTSPRAMDIEVGGYVPTSPTNTEITTETTNTITEANDTPQKEPKEKHTRQELDALHDAITEEWRSANGLTIMLRQQMLGAIPKGKPRYQSNFDTPVTPDEVHAFAKWYHKKFPSMPLPTTAEKLQTHFYNFRASHIPSTPTLEWRVNTFGVRQVKKAGMWIDAPQMELV